MDVLRVHLLGELALSWDEAPIPAIPGVAARSLLAYLITYRERPHTRDLLAGTFWPDLPDAVARRRLSQALWQIRRALGPQPVLQSEGNTVQLNPDLRLWLDVEEFGNLVGPPDDPAIPQKGVPITSLPIFQPASLQALHEAIELYRDEFLAGHYDDWLLSERERLREMFLAGLERLVEGCKAQGDYERALLHARRLASENPWREEAHREVMRLCYLLGRANEALEQYEICCQVLSEQPGSAPSPKTVALVRESRRHSSGIAARDPADRKSQRFEVTLPATLSASDSLIADDQQAPGLPLVGREAERAALLSHVEALHQGLGGIVLLEGEAGVGKSRLLQTVALDAEWRGAEVLWGSGLDLESAAPYGPLVEALRAKLSPLRAGQLAQLVERIWLQVLRPLLPELAVALPDLTPPPSVEPEREQERLVNAFVQLLTAWGQMVPLVLILEDLHWADQDSLRMLVALGQRLRAQRVLVIGSYRGDEAQSHPPVWEQLQDLHRAGLRDRLRLDPLDAEATGELIRWGLGTNLPAPLFESRLYGRTGGNPLFVLEILRALYDEGMLFQDEEGQWKTPWDETTTDYAEMPLPPAVERVIARRLARLDPPLRAVLDTAAVLGGDLYFHLLQEASGQETATLLAAVHTLVRRHFLVEQPAAYDFGHDEIRRVTYRSLSPDKLKEIHRRVAVALSSLHPERVASLAHHSAQAEMWDRAVESYVAVAREATTVYATEAALEAYGQAITILQAHNPFSEGRRAQIHFDVLLARHSLLRIKGEREAQRADVEALLALARTLAEPARQVEALLLQADFLSKAQSEYESAREAAEQALALAREHGLQRSEARAWMTIGHTWQEQGQNQAALDGYQQAQEAWREIGSADSLSAEVNLRLVTIYRIMGDLEQAENVAQTAIERAQIDRDPLNVAHAHNAMAWITRARGDHQAEAHHCRAMLTQMQDIGHRFYEGVALNNLSLAYVALGEHGQALEAAENALETFRQLDHRHGQAIILLNLSSQYKTTGQAAKARAVLDEGLRLAREFSFVEEQVRILLSLTQLLTHEGDYEAARAAVAQAEGLVASLDSPYMQATVHFRGGELLLETGDSRQAAERLEEAQRLYQVAGTADFESLAGSFLAASHYRLGNLAEAMRLSTRAMERIESLSGKYLGLEAYWNHYQIMAAAGERETALAALHQAYVLVQGRRATLPDPAWKRGFIEDVPAHRNIVAAWEALASEPVTVRLPRTDAPTGRPLHADEYVEVTWTVTAPEDEIIVKKTARRQARLRRLLLEAADQGAAPTVDALAQVLEVSTATVKRDLAAIRQEGHEVQTRGSRK